jgi:hypothetical protein
MNYIVGEIGGADAEVDECLEHAWSKGAGSFNSLSSSFATT